MRTPPWVAAHITVNKNAMPNDPRIALRHLRHPHRHAGDDHPRLQRSRVPRAAGWICDILQNMGDESVIDAVREKVKAVCARLPVYGK